MSLVELVYTYLSYNEALHDLGAPTFDQDLTLHLWSA